MTNMTDEHYCKRCGKRTGTGIHTCTPNPVIAQLAAELAEAKQLAADRLAQMDADRKQALAWRDELAALRADEGRLK